MVVGCLRPLAAVRAGGDVHPPHEPAGCRCLVAPSPERRRCGAHHRAMWRLDDVRLLRRDGALGCFLGGARWPSVARLLLKVQRTPSPSAPYTLLCVFSSTTLSDEPLSLTPRSPAGADALVPLQTVRFAATELWTPRRLRLPPNRAVTAWYVTRARGEAALGPQLGALTRPARSRLRRISVRYSSPPRRPRALACPPPTSKPCSSPGTGPSSSRRLHATRKFELTERPARTG